MKHKNGSGMWAGAILIIFGILLLADNFDIFYYLTPHHFPPFRLFSWPVIMLIVGTIVLSNNSRSFWGWFFIIIGGTNVLSRFMDFSFRSVITDFWPILLIGLGLLLLFKRREHRTLHFDMNFTDDEHSKIFNHIHDRKSNGEKTQSGITNGDEIDIVAIFNAVKRRVVSDNFIGGRISALFGGVDLFLNDSKLAKGEQVIDISCLFGGVDLYVPRDWRVIVKTVTIFGGFDDNRFQDASKAADDRVLIIRGFILFGGGDIKN